MPIILNFFNGKEEITLFPQQTWEIFGKTPNQLNLKIKPQNFEYTKPILITPETTKITVQDGLGGSQKVSLVWSELNGRVRVVFYAKAYLLNESDYELFVFSKEEKSIEIAGQRKKYDGEIFNSKIMVNFNTKRKKNIKYKKIKLNT